jgi:hypothetical protein
VNRAVTVLLVAATVVAPASASAAPTLAVDPVKDCYSTGETVDLLGGGFTPFGPVDVSDGSGSLGTLDSDAGGAISSPLTLGYDSGRVTFTATDMTTAGLAASTSLLVSAPDVTIRPRNGPAGRRVRITAKGFATGPTLYAHVRRRSTGRVRNVRIGALAGACGKTSVRKRIFPSGAPSGSYLVQFDTYRRFSRGRDVWVRFTVKVQAPTPPEPPRREPPPRPPTDCQGYSPCIAPGPDVDCAGGSGNGPRYVNGPVYVSGSDPYGLDSDGDGVACES